MGYGSDATPTVGILLSIQELQASVRLRLRLPCPRERVQRDRFPRSRSVLSLPYNTHSSTFPVTVCRPSRQHADCGNFGWGFGR